MKTTSTIVALGAVTLVGCSMGANGETDRNGASPVQAEATGATQYTYGWSTAGLMTSSATNGAKTSMSRAGTVLTAGGDTFTYDGLGRVSAIDAMAITYGADSQIDHATLASTTVSYVYDESGNRILTSTNGAPTAAYVDGLVVTPTELDEPVEIAGRHVGLLRNGAFAMTAEDMRGTVQADTTGAQKLASPFGVRTSQPDVAAIDDYAKSPFDAALGAVRMGVRDYDPRIARFDQPDPTYLLHPEKCIASPSECNLYGYAKGSPITFVDPTGNDAMSTIVDYWPHLFNVSVGVPFVSATLSVGTKGDNAGTLYFSLSLGPKMFSTSGWKLDDYKNLVSFSVTATRLRTAYGETNGATAARVDSYATGPTIESGGCLYACYSHGSNSSGEADTVGIGVGGLSRGAGGLTGTLSVGAGVNGSWGWRFGNRTDALADAAWKGTSWAITGKADGLKFNTPQEDAYRAAHADNPFPSAPSSSQKATP